MLTRVFELAARHEFAMQATAAGFISMTGDVICQALELHYGVRSPSVTPEAASRAPSSSGAAVSGSSKAVASGSTAPAASADAPGSTLERWARFSEEFARTSPRHVPSQRLGPGIRSWSECDTGSCKCSASLAFALTGRPFSPSLCLPPSPPQARWTARVSPR